MNKYRQLDSFIILGTFLLTISTVVEGAARMKQIPLRSHKISVSGHSSGAVAATQFYLSHSDLIDGIAVFSTMQYHCAGGGIVRLVPCLRGRKNVSESVDKAREYDRDGLIDPLENLKARKHYLHHGSRDVIIHFDNGVHAYEFFKQFSDNVRFHQSDSNHAVPTKHCGIHCMYGTVGSGCSKCDFSAVFEGLNYIYDGTLQEPTATTCRAAQPNDGIKLVDQSEFLFPFDSNVSLNPEAVLYTPRQCRANSSMCTLHVAFHGCRHSIQNDGMEYIKCSGYIEMADANNMIVLFPQIKQSRVDTITLFHCWDLHGYTGPLYGTKLGSQNQVVYNMIRRIMNGYSNDNEIRHWKPLAVVNEVDDEEDHNKKKVVAID
ncbi:hypothetical protein Ocin01_07902 [Orchesella cincta]|uniref:Uncharacterized protein n=1 Tax=Orchesella cincta TaxID=48709 RepID=A0A1D2N0H2_ORCCI|nr:hypothetical protein Ocin01_07902 [Orchesella cincta]